MKAKIIETSKTTIEQLEDHIEKSFEDEVGVKIVRRNKQKDATKTQIIFHEVFRYKIHIKSQSENSTKVSVKPGLTFNGFCLQIALIIAGVLPGIGFYFYSEYMQQLKGKDVIRIVKENKQLVAKSTIDRFGRIQRGMTGSDILEAAQNMERSGRYEEAAEAYDSISMFDKANSCRMLIQKNTVNIGHVGDISLVDSVMVGSTEAVSLPQAHNSSTNQTPPFNYSGEINADGFEICEYPKTSGLLWWKDYSSQTWVKWEK
tara:strand:- start:758 stop:1537 length:780 start_codon:yes stop_codon:yes gene_type:complete